MRFWNLAHRGCAQKWPDFDPELFDEIYNDDSQEREFKHHIYGYDVDIKAVNTARMNVKAAGLTSDITINEQDFKDFQQPQEPSIMVTNPPYGERISTPNLLATYKMIGERLKHQFTGNEAWILSYREECFDQIGLKPSIKIPLFNGSLECEFRKYQMFDGKMRVYREEGGIVKTEEEKRQMAEKHRFKKEREFKKRLDEQEENEGADIRNFKFHSLEKRNDRREERVVTEKISVATEKKKDARTGKSTMDKRTASAKSLSARMTASLETKRTTGGSMMTKTKLLILLLALLVLPYSVMNAQNRKLFTLEDLNFGGKNYRNLLPENKWYEWWGDQLSSILPIPHNTPTRQSPWYCSPTANNAYFTIGRPSRLHGHRVVKVRLLATGTASHGPLPLSRTASFSCVRQTTKSAN